MTANQKKRLCWNCDGTVDVHLSHCTYCGAELLRDQEPLDQMPQDEEEEAIFDEEESPFSNDEEEEEEEHEPARVRQRSLTLPFMLMVPGTLLGLFGLMVWLFSHDGALELRWDASYWYIYVLLSLPLLVFGWRALGRDDPQEEEG
jgi:hypothetical protein